MTNEAFFVPDSEEATSVCIRLGIDRNASDLVKVNTKLRASEKFE